MNEISSQLANHGFSINPLEKIIERNNYSRRFSTLEFFCIFLTSENLVFKVDEETYRVKGGNAIFIGPQKLVELLKDPRGMEFYVIAFSESFYDKTSNESIFLNSEIFFNNESHIFTAPYFGNKDFNKVILIERLFKFSMKGQILYTAAAHNTIESLLLDAHLFITHQNNETKPKSLYIQCFNKFNFFLQRDFKIAKNVSHYSDLLKVSPRKLTEITEKVCGKPAKQIIIDKIRLECLKAIKYSNDSFSEITYELGFNDEANFTNFVKKHLGKKPSEIRYEHTH